MGVTVIVVDHLVDVQVDVRALFLVVGIGVPPLLVPGHGLAPRQRVGDGDHLGVQVLAFVFSPVHGGVVCLLPVGHGPVAELFGEGGIRITSQVVPNGLEGACTIFYQPLHHRIAHSGAVQIVFGEVVEIIFPLLQPLLCWHGDFLDGGGILSFFVQNLHRLSAEGHCVRTAPSRLNSSICDPILFVCHGRMELQPQGQTHSRPIQGSFQFLGLRAVSGVPGLGDGEVDVAQAAVGDGGNKFIRTFTQWNRFAVGHLVSVVVSGDIFIRLHFVFSIASHRHFAHNNITVNDVICCIARQPNPAIPDTISQCYRITNLSPFFIIRLNGDRLPVGGITVVDPLLLDHDADAAGACWVINSRLIALGVAVHIIGGALSTLHQDILVLLASLVELRQAVQTAVPSTVTICSNRCIIRFFGNLNFFPVHGEGQIGR